MLWGHSAKDVQLCDLRNVHFLLGYQFISTNFAFVYVTCAELFVRN